MALTWLNSRNFPAKGTKPESSFPQTNPTQVTHQHVKGPRAPDIQKARDYSQFVGASVSLCLSSGSLFADVSPKVYGIPF